MLKTMYKNGDEVQINASQESVNELKKFGWSDKKPAKKKTKAK